MTFASSKEDSTPAQADSLPHQPIASLNPYKPKFTIKVKVDSKQPLKSAVIKGETTSILTMVLVDTEVCTTSGLCAAFLLPGAFHRQRIQAPFAGFTD